MWCVQLNTQTTYYLLFKNIPWDWDRLLYLEIECFVTVTVICLLVCLCMIERLDVWSSYCVIATETLAGSEVIFVIQFSSGVCSCAEHWIKKVCLFTCDQMTFVNKRWILPNVFFLFLWKREWILSYRVAHLFIHCILASSFLWRRLLYHIF